MPDMCAQYWPSGQPYPAGVVVAGPAITMSVDSARAGVVRVIDGRDGVEKDCLNYAAARQKCLQWGGEAAAPRRQVASVTPTKLVGKPVWTRAAKPRPPALPTAITAPKDTPEPPPVM
jgi:hypothetical protein